MTTALDPVRPIARVEIFRVIPGGSRRARTQRQALEALGADAELSAMRADRQAHIREVWRILVRRASWRDRTTRPVIWCQACRSGGDCRGGPRQACLCRAADISPATWKRIRAWLERRGYLATVRQGSTVMFLAAVLSALADGQGHEAPNEAAVYVLCIPRSKTAPGPRLASLPRKNEPLTPSDRTVVNVPAHEQSQDQEIGSARAEAHFLDAVARIGRISAGQPITEGWVGYLIRPYLAAGWAWADLSYAVAHDPDDTPHRTSLKHIKAPRAWLAWRLSKWIGPDGSPLPSHRHELERRRDRRLAEIGARRQADAELAEARVDPAPFAAAIRERLGWARGRAREGTRVRWIEYADTGDHAGRRNGRPREGVILEGGRPGPLPGTVLAGWDTSRPPIIVHWFPDSPERNYSLNSEQP